MCGIVGYATVDALQFDSAVLHPACDAMSHRGPDGHGEWHDAYCGLGHRRLSIIDLETGAQPMSYADGRYSIVFNGEIYNYRALRAELSASGFKFLTRSDTEVILAAFAAWGLRAAARLRGIFAFAIWDRDDRSLVLARDHFGVKPLLYALQPGAIVFASELKALLATGLIAADADRAALSDYLALGYTLGTRTMIRRVSRVEPGTVVVWRRGEIDVTQYWDLAEIAQRDPLTSPPEQAIEEYRSRLHEAVGAQMVSDVPVGAFLSGGLDSSSVVYHMQSSAASAVQTFSIGFVEKSYSETRYAEQTASGLGTGHHTEVVGESVSELLPDIVAAFDEPLGDTSIVPTYFVSRLARRFVKVALSGDGADETLAGYDTYVADALQRRYRRIPAWLHDGVAMPLSRLIPDSRRKLSVNYRVKQFVRQAHADWRRAHFGWRLVFDDAPRSALLGCTAVEHDPFADYRRLFDEVTRTSELNQALYVDIKTWLANDILVKVDRASMSVGLEARVPFLDPSLVEYSFALPPSLKLRGVRRKIVLRRAMDGLLPQAALRRPKRGFLAPVSDWLRTSLRPVLDELLAGESALVDVGHPVVRRMWSDHVAGRADHGFRLWALTSLLLWEHVVLNRFASARVRASTLR